MAFSRPLLLLLLPLLISTTTSKQDLVKTSCVHASFPNLCLRTLSSYTGPANTPRDLAQAALKVSLSHAHGASAYLTTLQAHTRREHFALADCVDQVGDAVEQLRKSLKEIKCLRGGTFRWQMSNVETWVSAALTNDETCLDGFKEASGGKVRKDVNGRITNLARVTSNALYLINQLDKTRGKSVFKP